VYRTNAGQFFTREGQPVKGLPRGFSDILYIRDGGKACFIECKSPGGVVSPDQEKFLHDMRSIGAVAGVARSIDDALDLCGLIP